MGRMIMDMTRATILEGSLDDDLWPEVILAITYVKNVWPTKTFDWNNPYSAQHDANSDIQHLRILGSTVYVFLHEEKRTLKSEKWEPRALRGTLVGYDGNTIYKVHLQEQNKIIRIKDLCIIKDYKTKAKTRLLAYQNTPTFQGFRANDNDKADQKLNTSPPPRQYKDDIQEITSTPRNGRKVRISKNAGTQTSLPSQKVGEVENMATELNNNAPLRKSRKISTNDAVRSTSCSATPVRGWKVKIIDDARNLGINSDTSPSHPHTNKRSRAGRTLKPTEKASQNKTLITFFTSLLDHDWDTSPEESAQAFLTKLDKPETEAEDDLLKILTSRLLKANVVDPGEYVFATQLDVEEPETYNKAMSGAYAQQWSQAMKEELHQLEANKTWSLAHRSQIKPSLKPLGGKWVYKVKQDVNGKKARFKARWVVKSYLQ